MITACGVFTSAGIAPPDSAPRQHVDGARPDELGEERAAGDELAALKQRIEQRAALAADREAAHSVEPEPVRRFDRGEDRVIVDAEKDVDVGMGLKRIEAGAKCGAEDAAAVDPPVADLAVEDLREAVDEAVTARPGVGQRLERDDEDPRRLDLSTEAAGSGLAEIAARGDIVGAEIGAAGLRCRLGEKGDAPPPRHEPQRLRAFAFERRQDDGVGIVDGESEILRGRGGFRRSAPAVDPGDAAMAPSERTVARKPGDVAADRYLGHPSKPAGKIANRRDADLVEDGENARFSFSFDHI